MALHPPLKRKKNPQGPREMRRAPWATKDDPPFATSSSAQAPPARKAGTKDGAPACGRAGDRKRGPTRKNSVWGTRKSKSRCLTPPNRPDFLATRERCSRSKGARWGPRLVVQPHGDTQANFLGVTRPNIVANLLSNSTKLVYHLASLIDSATEIAHSCEARHMMRVLLTSLSAKAHPVGDFRREPGTR
jgi:hypothetical protein